MEGFVNFLGDIFEVGVIDFNFLGKVVLINTIIKRMVQRNSYKVERFIDEVTLSQNGKKGTINNDHKLYKRWHLYNEKKYRHIVFAVSIIALNVMNMIKRRLFKDDIQKILLLGLMLNVKVCYLCFNGNQLRMFKHNNN